MQVEELVAKQVHCCGPDDNLRVCDAMAGRSPGDSLVFDLLITNIP